MALVLFHAHRAPSRTSGGVFAIEGDQAAHLYVLRHDTSRPGKDAPWLSRVIERLFRLPSRRRENLRCLRWRDPGSADGLPGSARHECSPSCRAVATEEFLERFPALIERCRSTTA